MRAVLRPVLRVARATLRPVLRAVRAVLRAVRLVVAIVFLPFGFDVAALFADFSFAQGKSMLLNGAEQKHARVHVHNQLFSNLWRAHASSVWALETSSASQRRPRKELRSSKIHFDILALG